MRPLLIAPALTLLLAGCGSSDKKSDSAAKPEGTKTAGSATTTATAPKLPGGHTVKGTGYTFSVPARWRDASAALEGSAIRFDSAYVNPAGSVPKENIVVIRETPA